MQSLELTLILAATRNMGIGAQGTMPWTGLRKEMQYFARVTTRIPPHSPAGTVNAVIMGRKTWDSIPPKFRPLKNRLNIVVSRAHTPAGEEPAAPFAAYAARQPVRVASLDHALRYARDHAAAVGHVFIMGGGQIYDAAVRLPEARRVLLTSIDADFACDTFFRLALRGAEGDEVPADAEVGGRWVRRTRDELKSWAGEEEVAEGVQEEAGTKYEFQMWERVD